MERYNIQFLPELQHRTKLRELKYRVSKKVGKSIALNFPVHMSLISGGFNTKDIDIVIQEIKEACKGLSPIDLTLGPKTDTLIKKGWVGFHVYPAEEINVIRRKLHKIRNRYATEKEKHEYHPPHITLAYPADVTNFKPISNPVKKMNFNRVTLLVSKPNGKYKILKHFKLG
jgi:2'-5' RNA ligase